MIRISSILNFMGKQNFDSKNSNSTFLFWLFKLPEVQVIFFLMENFLDISWTTLTKFSKSFELLSIYRTQLIRGNIGNLGEVRCGEVRELS